MLMSNLIIKEMLFRLIVPTNGTFISQKSTLSCHINLLTKKLRLWLPHQRTTFFKYLVQTLMSIV